MVGHCETSSIRQDFGLNLSAKRRLCHTAAYRCAVTAARSRAEATTNLACSSLALALRAFFGGKNGALVNVLMICPPVVGRRPNSAPDHGDLMTKKGPAFRPKGDGALVMSESVGFRSKAIRDAGMVQKERPRRSGAGQSQK